MIYQDIYDEEEELDIRSAKIKTFRKALIDHGGFIARAADACGISRSTANEWIKKNKKLKRLLDELRNQRHGDYEDDDDDD